VFDLVGTFFEEPSRRRICFQLTDAVAIGLSLYWLEVGMPFVIAAPEMMTAAATDLATIGSNVNAAHMVAAAPTLAVIPAAADEVSTGIARVFSQHAANYQSLAGQAAAFNGQFVQHLSAGAFSYADIEAKLASLLQNLQELPAFANGLISFAAADPQQFLEFLGTEVLLGAFALYVVFWIGVILGFVGLLSLYYHLSLLLASFGI
jgi:hypothetical protein